MVEDERNLARSLVRLLEGEQYAAEAVHDGEDGLHYALSGQYDLMILDVMLPSLGGFEVAASLRQQGSSIPILMLTALGEVQDKVRGLDSGADDYLTKPFTAEELLARVRAMLRRPAPLQMEALVFGDLCFSISSSTLSRGDKQVRLSRKEHDVMHALMAVPGRIVSKEELILKAWGADSDAMDNNVEAYISFLRKKLHFLGSKVQITAQRRLGYLLEAEAC